MAHFRYLNVSAGTSTGNVNALSIVNLDRVAYVLPIPDSTDAYQSTLVLDNGAMLRIQETVDQVWAMLDESERD